MIVCTKSVILIYEVIERANAWSVRVRCLGICSRSVRQRGPKRGILGVRELLDHQSKEIVIPDLKTRLSNKCSRHQNRIYNVTFVNVCNWKIIVHKGCAQIQYMGVINKDTKYKALE